MSKADKMFEDLGYEKKEDVNYITYNIDYIELIFDKNNEVLVPSNNICLNDEDIECIYDKMKELGWFDE